MNFFDADGLPAKTWLKLIFLRPRQILPLSLAKMLSTSKMARFAFSLGLKTKPVLDQDLLLERQGSRRQRLGRDAAIRIGENWSSSGSPIVTMVQPAESLMTEDAAGTYGANPPSRRSLPESQMRAVFVVVADVFRKQSFQMAFVHGDDVIQQIPPTAFHPALRDAVLPGTFERSLHRLHPQASNS